MNKKITACCRCVGLPEVLSYSPIRHLCNEHLLAEFTEWLAYVSSDKFKIMQVENRLDQFSISDHLTKILAPQMNVEDLAKEINRRKLKVSV